MKLTDLLYPDCHLCRTLRISMGIAAIFVIATYVAQLIGMNREAK